MIDDSAAILMTMLQSVLRPKTALYACGALTTGASFYLTPPDTRVDSDKLRLINQKNLTRFAERLRETRPEPVIDPGLLRVRGWTGDHYGSFFLEVISIFAKEIHLCDGWEYSRGSTKEFVYGIQNGIPFYAEDGERVSLHNGFNLISEAVRNIEKYGHSAERLRRRLEQLADIEGAIRDSK